MQPYAVAISAYNPVVERNKDIPIFARLPTMNIRPLETRVSIYLASSQEEAETEALQHCQALFPASRGWEHHTVTACDIARTLLTEVE